MNKFRNFIKKIIPKYFLDIYKILNKKTSIKNFIFDNNTSSLIKKDIQEKYNHNSELLDIFCNNDGFVVHKWHHYIPIYEKYFSRFRGKKIRFLEIGVGKGGSLQMWRKYFGSDAIIFGIDIDHECKKFNTETEKIRIGSQNDETFLNSVIKEMGGVDIILDDGSHHMKHIVKTLSFLFPKLNYDGIYMIEDLHTSYWKDYGGGYNSNKNFFKFIRDLADDIHHWYHSKKPKHLNISKDCSGIHMHDSIVVLDKNNVFRPTHSKIGDKYKTNKAFPESNEFIQKPEKQTTKNQNKKSD